MYARLVFLLLFLGSFSVYASTLHESVPNALNAHRRVLQRRVPHHKDDSSPKTPKTPKSSASSRRSSKHLKKCKANKEDTTTSSSSSHSSSTSTQPTKTSSPSPKATPKTTSQSSPSNSGSNNGGTSGLINVKSSCGAIGATKEITAVSGPNGNINWLDCGINDGGWQPPFVRVSDIITADLPSAVEQSSSPFKACKPYISVFEKYGKEFGVPSIMLASFAMQESSCNPNTVGGGGEQGLMQISPDKCDGAPGGDCKNADFNIRTGAKYFSDTLNGNGGDLLLTIGNYNGWFRGMTYGQATAARHSSCCLCQNNLDYIHQFLNGWVLNVDSYSHNPPLGKYFNLNVCH